MEAQLSAEQEQVVERAIDAGLISVVSDVVGVCVATIRGRLEAQGWGTLALNHDEWRRELQAWIGSHSTTGQVLSDEAIGRGSIYGTRGD